jgi:hypothetical protein
VSGKTWLAGHHALPAAAPLPVLSFRRSATSRSSETLRLPVAKGCRQYEALVEACSRACVGAGDKTVVNLDVRKCRHLLPDDFSIDNAQDSGRAPTDTRRLFTSDTFKPLELSLKQLVV